MVWIFVAVLLCLVVFVPEFRKVVLIGVALLVAICILVVNSWRTPAPTYASSPTSVVRQAPVTSPAPREIASKQIEVDNIRSNFGYPSGNQISSITARIYNNSEQDRLDRAEYELLIEDCGAKRTARCTTVDDEKGSFDLDIPPRQARDTTIYVKTSQFNGVTILGMPHINVLITRAIAKE